MSNGKFTIKLLFLSLAALCLATSVSAFSVFAEPDETYAIESFVADTTQWVEDTYSDETYEDYTEEYYEETEDFTEEYVEPEYTEAESTAETVASSEVNGSTSATQVTTEATEPSYRAPLPEIEDTEITPPTVVGAVEDKFAFMARNQSFECFIQKKLHFCKRNFFKIHNRTCHIIPSDFYQMQRFVFHIFKLLCENQII